MCINIKTMEEDQVYFSDVFLKARCVSRKGLRFKGWEVTLMKLHECRYKMAVKRVQVHKYVKHICEAVLR